MVKSNDSEDHLAVFWPDTAPRGINYAIAKNKKIVCFFTDGRKESRRWERLYFQESWVKSRSRSDTVVIRVEAGSIEAKFMKRFIPSVYQAPAVFVMTETEVRGCIQSGVTKNQFLRRLHRKLSWGFDRTKAQFIDPEPYVDEDKLEVSPAKLMAATTRLEREGLRRFGTEQESYEMRRYMRNVRSSMAPAIAKFSRNTRRIFQAYFNDEQLTYDVEKIRTEVDYEQCLVTREAARHHLAKPVKTGQYRFPPPSMYQYPWVQPPQPEKAMVSTKTHPVCTVNVRTRYFRYKTTFQGNLPISVLRSWLQREHPTKIPEEYTLRIIKKNANYDLCNQADELEPFSKYSGGCFPSCVIKVVPLSEPERQDEEEQEPQPMWFETITWFQIFVRVLQFLCYTWPYDIFVAIRDAPDTRKYREEEAELRRQGRWHITDEATYGMGWHYHGRHRL